MKKCSRCKIEKDISEFYRNKTEKDGYHHYCKICNLARVNQYYLENPEKAKYTRDKLYRRHGINKEIFQELLSKQDSKCAICKNELNLSNFKQINIDHSHKCCNKTYSCGKCIRGLLCSKCNKAIGLFNDSIDMLDSAIKYINGDGR